MAPSLSRNVRLDTEKAFGGLRSSTKLVGLTAFVGTFVDGFMYGVLIPVLPYSLVDRSGIAAQDIQFWLSTMLVVFGVSSALCSPLAGWACSRSTSMKSPFLVAQGMALISTLLMCFGINVWVLVLARCFQGLSAVTTYITSVGMINDSVDKAVRGAWIGFALSGLSTSLVISPFLGGFLYEYGGYYAVFYITFGLFGVAILLRLLIIDVVPHNHKKSVSPNENTHRNDRPAKAASHCAANERDETEPLLGHGTSRSYGLGVRFHVTALIFGSKRLRAALVGGFVHAIILTSFDAILPLKIRHTFGWGSTLTGTVFLAIALPSLLTVAAGAVSDRIGPRKTTLSGFVVVICGMVPMVLIQHNNSLDKIMLYGLLIVIGTGLTFVLSPLAADVTAEADELSAKHPEAFQHSAFPQVYAIFNVGIGIATALGPALSGLLYAKTDWKFTIFFLTALCVLASSVVFAYTGGLDSTHGQERESDVEEV